MTKNTLANCVLFSALTIAVLAPTAASAQDPVQVYILMGQSNMVGAGTVTGDGSDGTLVHAVNTEGKYQYLSDGLGGWAAPRTDVRNVRVMSSGTGTMSVYNNEWMEIPGTTKIGPEFGIGKKLGDAIDKPVLILKSCIGNRSLGWDLLPPGSEQYVVGDYTYAGYGDSPDKWLTGTTPTPIGWKAGLQYDGDVRNAKEVLNNLGSYGFTDSTEYEVAGFFWWQGDKDRYNEVYSARYEQNLVQLINTLREEFNAPNANFVAATLGQTVIGATGNEGLILDAQFAVADDAQYPEFAGYVDTVYTHPVAQGGSSNAHYGGNAEVYMDVGELMGDAMVSMLKTLPYLEVHQRTGEIKIVNPSDGDINMNFADYSITSAVGALDASDWTTISGNYDLAGNKSVDADGNWTVGTSTNGALSEAADAGGGDGLIAINNEVSLGIGAWVQNPTKDLKFTYTDTDGIPRALNVRYVGDPIVIADLNFDGTIDELDWPIFRDGNQTDMSLLSPAEAYQMGDLDGDGDSDIDDFDLFRIAFEQVNPAEGAFEAMIANSTAVPEPSSILLLAIGAAGFGIWRKRRVR